MNTTKNLSPIVLVLCLLQTSPTVKATDTPEQLVHAALQRLHWNGLYLPEIKITISRQQIATVTGTVATDIIKAEVVRTIKLTDGISDVINQLAVTP